MKITAIDWLVSQIAPHLDLPIDMGTKIIEQAKQMEKDQIREAFYSDVIYGFEMYYRKCYIMYNDIE